MIDFNPKRNVSSSIAEVVGGRHNLAALAKRENSFIKC